MTLPLSTCFFWYRPTRVVSDKRPLKGCCCCCCCCWSATRKLTFSLTVCVCICVCICVCLCDCMSVCVCTSACVWLCAYFCVSACVWLYDYLCASVCVDLFAAQFTALATSRSVRTRWAVYIFLLTTCTVSQKVLPPEVFWRYFLNYWEFSF